MIRTYKSATQQQFHSSTKAGNKRKMKCRLLLIWLVSFLSAQAQQKIIVDAAGKGNFNSIQLAINSLSDSSAVPRIIFIKKGIYKEKIFIEKHNIVLEGEDKNNTVLLQSIARDEFRCNNTNDWGVATINLQGNDITLKNLNDILISIF